MLELCKIDPDQVAVIGWQSTCTRPLWMCAHIPRWISPSLSHQSSDPENEEAEHLAGLFRHVAGRLDPLFVKALDCDDIRKALEGLVRFDAVQDAFLLLPTLESLAATLPGAEDVDGLTALLDPNTLAGRVARISLVTKGGSHSLALASQSPLEMSRENTGMQQETGRNSLGLEVDAVRSLASSPRGFKGRRSL